MKDIRGMEVSVGDRQTLDLFEEALVAYQTYFGDPLATIEAALAIPRWKT